MSALPQPRNPRRMLWSEVPDAVVAAIGARAGGASAALAAPPRLIARTRTRTRMRPGGKQQVAWGV